jgi:hypothetical protein
MARLSTSFERPKERATAWFHRTVETLAGCRWGVPRETAEVHVTDYGLGPVTTNAAEQPLDAL